MICVISIALCMLACDSLKASAQIIRVTVERSDCSDGRYCRRVRECGSGVVISADKQRAYALTAAHVVKHAGNVRVQESAAAKVIARDDDSDVAVIEIGGRYEGKVASLGVAQTGSAVHLCGYGGGELARADGLLSSPQWITATAREGDSGGPVFDSRTSQVVGIAIGVHKSGQTLIVPSVTLHSFVARHCPQSIEAATRNPPQQRQSQITASDIPDREKTARIAALESRLAAAESLISRLQQQDGKTVSGPPGIPGRDGKPGPVGPPGKDAALLPLTITLNTLADDGKIVGSVTKTYQPGEPVVLNFKPIPASK